ncbi:hypothetical protein ASPACDRAFT_1851741 [Aspergillus aculeatus ATCC 16872]|uniref:Uncharacterized protein n=1 Tax=Aspergillus aculeatus (strain ATCC 16872 / CBS 172.66 / WB 5094) TaxID=690307 RepID=A0A1L9X8Y3_ASPA1|nr:uncharacterized protein ASPACDRAFT_1851741 [Aspergillus aculeatus ATCC 16872]OJK04779.1 hypothetical protein ASPACDRAFT_1851741 [Aspergillus aculeatus ATCC 16872]
MRCTNVKTAIPKNNQIASLGIIYSVACIVCALVLLQRIRRRRLRYASAERQMDPLSSSLEKGGGDGPSSPVGQGYGVAYLQYPISHHASSFPSACDVLQPLSHSSQLPSSGYLAAVLTRERSSWTSQHSYSSEELAQPAPGNAAMNRIFNSSTCQNDLGGLSPERLNGGSMAPNAPPRTGSSPVGWRTESHSQEPPLNVAESSGTQPTRKSEYAVQYMRDADEEGVRTWKRVVVEYS